MPVEADEQLLVHVGHHKTGSTWLQETVFDAWPSFQRPWSRGDMKRVFVQIHDLDFDPETARRELESLRRLPRAPGVLDVLSHERLAGNPHAGGYDSRTVADRLAATLPHGRVLMVIREQAPMILSCYKQYVRVGGTHSLSRYVSPPPAWGDRVPQFTLDHFAYDRLVAHYQRLFGAERVCVLPFELLNREPEAFARAVATFASVPCGPVTPDPRREGWGGFALGTKRAVNLFLVRDQINPGAPFESRRFNRRLIRVFDAVNPRVPERLARRGDAEKLAQVRAVIAGRFLESNRRTAELTGLDLAQYGYEL